MWGSRRVRGGLRTDRPTEALGEALEVENRGGRRWPSQPPIKGDHSQREPKMGAGEKEAALLQCRTTLWLFRTSTPKATECRRPCGYPLGDQADGKVEHVVFKGICSTESRATTEKILASQGGWKDRW